MTAIKAVQPEFLTLSLVQSKKLLPEVFAPPPLQKKTSIAYCAFTAFDCCMNLFFSEQTVTHVVKQSNNFHEIHKIFMHHPDEHF